MNIEKQCEIARLMTGSQVSDESILNGVQSMNLLVKEEASYLVDKLLRKLDMPFDKGYAKAKTEFIKIAGKYDVDIAALFWVYMEWRKSNEA